MNLLVVILLGAWALVWAVCCIASEPSGRGESMDYNRERGQYRVRYPDGRLSQPLFRDVAEDYAAIFGGEVIPK